MLSVKLKTITDARQKAKRAAARKADYIEYRDIDRALLPALYYGFTPLPSPLSITREDRELARELAETDMRENAVENSLVPFIEQRVAFLRSCLAKGVAEGPLPVLSCGEETLAAGTVRKDGRQSKCVFLDVIGSGKSIAEALLIKTSWTILQEEGVKDLTLALNSMGDRESLARFVRELAGYYRKNLHTLPPQCRAGLRRDPLLALSCAHEKCAPLKADAPKGIEFLSEASRAHFKEVLEYLEALAIPYRLDHCLVGSKSFMSETIFEIRGGGDAKEENSEERVCFGFRYDNAAKRLGLKKEMPAIGATVFLSRSARTPRGERGICVRKPRLFFLQLGFDAKLQSLKLIESLRQAGIPLHQALARDKLATQLATAEHLKIPYSLIMGQKEAMEESVIVRNNATRAQETIKITELPSYLKKLKIA